jgi:hypothetical protein
MLIQDVNGRSLNVPDNVRLEQAIAAGAVKIWSVEPLLATILAPPGFAGFSDDEIVDHLQFATELGKLLEDIGFTVRY